MWNDIVATMFRTVSFNETRPDECFELGTVVWEQLRASMRIMKRKSMQEINVL